MFTNDYVLRMIEMLGRAISRIVRLQEEDRTEESRTLLHETLSGSTGLNAHTIDTLEYEALVTILNADGSLSASKRMLYSELLRLKADFSQEEGDSAAAVSLRVKALNLALEALLEDERFADPPRMDRITGLMGALAGQELPEWTQKLIERYRQVFLMD